jgi:hypothetical protein
LDAQLIAAAPCPSLSSLAERRDEAVYAAGRVPPGAPLISIRTSAVVAQKTDMRVNLMPSAAAPTRRGAACKRKARLYKAKVAS